MSAPVPEDEAQAAGEAFANLRAAKAEERERAKERELARQNLDGANNRLKEASAAVERALMVIDDLSDVP
ncbi:MULTISPECIES: hypothetical protein [unclassified Aeromicrobium]|uniref:hypothetical protein n=1 Tax=unclassified Aeromicrobium TaxID=2633570 RepID=UPI0028890E92|nr:MULTISPECIES: hypothetical protein [unclassified Aeromicrobium]